MKKYSVNGERYSAFDEDTETSEVGRVEVRRDKRGEQYLHYIPDEKQPQIWPLKTSL